MNVAWKFIAVLALLFSLTALTIEIVRIQRDSDAGMQQEMAAKMQARELAFIERLTPRLNALRQDRDLLTKPIRSFEDLGEAMTELIGTPIRSEPQSSARP
jgi:hypothetical protein